MAHHGNTPAAWTAVTVAMVGFVVGGIGLMMTPVNMTVFWVAAVITALETAGGAGFVFSIRNPQWFAFAGEHQGVVAYAVGGFLILSGALLIVADIVSPIQLF